ncbi:MAG: hypothetical protein N3D16_04315 [Anaerolineales bacterium]|nr:hypothetical protein [Anaerolineales bacterium]
MEKPPSRPLPPPNPITTQKHRRESLLQITLPFLGALAILIGLAFLLGKATTFNTAQGAQIALIGLILPTMLFGLLFFLITIALLVGVTKLLGILPTYTRSVQDFFTLVAYQTRRVADGSVEPILRLQEWAAIWQRLRRGGFH